MAAEEEEGGAHEGEREEKKSERASEKEHSLESKKSVAKSFSPPLEKQAETALARSLDDDELSPMEASSSLSCFEI